MSKKFRQTISPFMRHNNHYQKSRMKKFYFLLVALVATLCSPTASANVELRGSSDVQFYDEINYYHAGQTIPRDPSRVVAICPDGYILSKVYVNGSLVYDYDTADQAEDTYVWHNYEHDEPLASMEASVKKLSDVQTGRFTVKSDASVWLLYYCKTFGYLDDFKTVKAGESLEKFIPGRDKLKISFSRYNNFYCIKRNGELVTLKPEKYNEDILLPLEDGDVIEIVTEVPDKMCHIDIVSPNGETGFVLKAYYKVYDENGREKYTYVENSESFDAPAGSTVNFTWNFNDFREPINEEFEAYKGILNGKDVEFKFSSIGEDFAIPVDRDNITVVFLADRQGFITLQVDVDNASNIVAKSGEEVFDLHDGLQEVTIQENFGLYFYPKSSSVLTSINANGKEYITDSQNHNPRFYELLNNLECNALAGGLTKDIIHVATAKRERTIPVKIFVADCGENPAVYTDSYIDSPYFFGVAEGENSVMMHQQDFAQLMIDLTESNAGGHVYAYPKAAAESGDNMFKISTSGAPEYEVIRIYGSGMPTYHTVSVTSEFDETEYSLRRDYHDAITGKMHSLPHGTVFHIDMEGDNNADVYVNGSKLASVSPLSHSFVVTEPSDVEIRKSTTGIENVDIDSNEAPVYYNLQGVRIDNPSNGIYIEVRNGKATRRYIR